MVIFIKGKELNMNFFRDIIKNALKDMIAKLSKELIKVAIRYVVICILGYYMKKRNMKNKIKKGTIKKFLG